MRRAILAAPQLATRASCAWYSRLWVAGAAMRLTAQWKAEARPPASVTAVDANARPLDLGKWKSIVGNSPCDPRAIERRTASLHSYLRQVDRPSYLLPV